MMSTTIEIFANDFFFYLFKFVNWRCNWKCISSTYQPICHLRHLLSTMLNKYWQPAETFRRAIGGRCDINTQQHMICLPNQQCTFELRRPSKNCEYEFKFHQIVNDKNVNCILSNIFDSMEWIVDIVFMLWKCWNF